MSQHSTLYYEGYDPTWIIGTGKPPPVYSPHIIVPNRPMAAIPPIAKLPVHPNGLVPLVQVPHVQPHQQGIHKLRHEPLPHGGKGAAYHGQIGKSNLGPIPMAQTHFIETGKLKLVGSNPNPYLQTTVVQPSVRSVLPPVVVHAQTPIASGPVPVIPLVPVVPAPGAPAVASVVRAKGPAQVPTAVLRDIPVNPIIKVVMWVPMCCEACEKNWKEKLTDLPGFQGFDVEKRLDRVSVFGHVSPSSVLSTIQKVVPRAQMWRH